MTLAKKAAAGLAAVGMAAGLTVAGAGAASAAVVPAPRVLGNSVSVDIAQPLPGQSCSGMLVPPAVAGSLIGPAASGDLMQIMGALSARDDVIALRHRAIVIDLPATIPGVPGTLYANDVPANFYALAVFCVGAGTPIEAYLHPAVVGNPLDAFAGSAAGSTGS